MSRLGDVADYLLEPDAAGGYTTASDSERDMTDAEVEVIEERARKVMNKKERERHRAMLHQQREEQAAAAQQVADGDEADEQSGNATKSEARPHRAPRTQKRTVKLTEIGPRMRLRLYKVEEGLCAGKTLWHETVVKSAGEERELEKMWEGRRKEKEERKRVQKENVEKKKKEAKVSKRANGGGGKGDEDDDDDEDAMDAEGLDWSDLEDEMEVDGDDEEMEA